MKAVADVIRTGERRVISLAPERDRYWAAEFYPVLDEQKMLAGVGALVRDLTAIVHAERVLRDHADFEELVSRISAQLARTPAHEVEGQIEAAIQEAARFLRIETGELLRIGPRNLEGRGVGPELKYKIVSIADIPWLMGAMHEGRYLAIADAAADLPPISPAERDILVTSGIKSFLALPLTVGGTLIGVAFFSTVQRARAWEPEILDRLHLLAQVLANVLARRRADDELRRQRDELLHLWRIGTVNEATATIAHDVRQPLTAIIANAAAGSRFLTMASPPLGEVRDALTEIQRDAQRAADVVSRARELLGRSEPGHVAFDLKHLLEETVRLAQPSSTLLRADLSLSFDGPVPRVMGDPAQIQQVVLNLISNAAESVAELAAPPREVRVSCAAQDGWAVVEVADTGPGLPGAMPDRVFEPFFTTKERGLGLGLPLCQTIIERHGGKITAENRPPRGAVLRFTLPPAELVS
jgi:signal transduction histidine kinase